MKPLCSCLKNWFFKWRIAVIEFYLYEELFFTQKEALNAY